MRCVFSQGVQKKYLSIVAWSTVTLAVTGFVSGQDVIYDGESQFVQDEEFDQSGIDELDFLDEEEPYHPNVGKIEFGGGVDFTNAYFFRGVLQEDQGFIAQPWAEATFDLYDGGGLINDLTLTLGIWNSIHDENTGHRRAQSLHAWYESDLYFTFSLGLGDNVGIGVTYVTYTSPNDAFATIHEIMFGIQFDDRAMWENTAVQAPGFIGLQPSLTFAIETENTAFGSDEGSYLEFAIEPGFTTFAEFGGNPVTLTFPMKVGISLDNYYKNPPKNDTFGFFDIGVVGSWPLSFVAPDYGAWDFAAGVHFLFLSDVLETANNGDDFEIIATVSVSMGY